MTKMLAIRIPVVLDRRLARLARRSKLTKTEVARDALLEHLDDLEDYYVGLARVEEKFRSMSLSEVERKLGIRD